MDYNCLAYSMVYGIEQVLAQRRRLPRIMVVYYREDDPAKNTALKMIRKNLAIHIYPRRIHGSPIILDPYSNKYLGPWDHIYVEKHGIVVVDASWKKLAPRKTIMIKGQHRKLPPLLPGNPINYGKPCILSSIEAVAATLYITGFIEAYEKLLGLYKWMKTFHTLNNEVLEAYRRTRNYNELLETIKDYWGEKPPC